MPTRLITFAGSTLSIEYHGDQPAEIIDFLYRYLPPGGEDSPQVKYRVLEEQETGQLSFYLEDELLYQGDDPAYVADFLLGNSGYQIAHHSKGGLLFHSGGLAWQGKGLILPGITGAGKTTLTAWLLTQGLDYLTDELVYVPHKAHHIECLMRPLNLKHASWAVLQDEIDSQAHADRIYYSIASDLLSPAIFAAGAQPIQPPLTLIIFPCYQTDRHLELQPLTKAQTGMALNKCLTNAHNLDDHGFAEIVRLAKRTPAYKMTYGSFDQVGDQIKSLMV